MRQRRRKGRDVSGLVLLDKPSGLSSNAALQRVKRAFFARKAGHTGSLDPLATGLLPICLGEATKVSQFLLDSDKQYLASIKLGEQTDTGDAEGEVINSRSVDVSREDIEQALSAYRGDIKQVPPMYSALKKDGQPLYKLARKGETVEREARAVSIFRNELLSCEGEKIELFVACSKGTYIRSLAEDLGEDLGCGGHITALRRLQSGSFAIGNPFSGDGEYGEHVVTLAELEQRAENEGAEALDSLLVPMDRAVAHLPAVLLPELAADSVRHGQAVTLRHLPAEGLVRMYAAEPGEKEAEQAGEFIGIGEIDDDGKVAPKRLIVSESH